MLISVNGEIASRRYGRSLQRDLLKRWCYSIWTQWPLETRLP